jgi:hypothetical protein
VFESFFDVLGDGVLSGMPVLLAVNSMELAADDDSLQAEVDDALDELGLADNQDDGDMT